VYTVLLREDRDGLRPGRAGQLSWKLDGRQPIEVGVEVRENAVWPLGRVFLTCPGCGRRATRIYVPTEQARAACRRCWGLTYESRQERTYRLGRSWWGRLLGVGSYAMSRAQAARRGRAKAATQRESARRRILDGR